jgi:hypothetical protein
VPRKPYTVENQRPRRTVNLYGSVLAPKGKGRTSCTDLDLEEVLGAPSLRLLAVGRLKVVRGDMAPVAAKLAELSSEEEPAPAPKPKAEAAPPAPKEESKEEEPAPPEDPPAGSESGSSDSETTSTDPDGSTDEPSEEASAPSWTYDELKAMNAAEQKAICRELGIKTGGREEERIKRILDHLAGTDGE